MLANGQGRPIDWPSYGNDAQRTGWEKSDVRITKDNVQDFKLVLKRKLDNPRTGPHSLTPPVVLGLLISYRGFKELAFVASSDRIWAIDVDVDKIFWEKKFDVSGKSGACAGGFATTPALIPPINFGARRPGMGAPRPAAPPAEAPPPTGRAIIGAAGGFGVPRPVFGVSSDGKVHLMNTSTGDDVAPPIQFLPAGSRTGGITVTDGTLYAATLPECGGGGVYALDLNSPEENPKIASYPLSGGTVSDHGGLALGNGGTVYVQNGNTLLALAAKTLQKSDAYTMTDAGQSKSAATPVVFTQQGVEMIATAGQDGRVYLFQGKSLGRPVYQSPVLATGPDAGIWGGLSTWSDSAGTRWLLAPVWGKLNDELGLKADASHGSVVAFRVEDKDGKPSLTPAWASRDMVSPEPPVTTGGIVFALSTGGNSNAILYALDGATGKELYSSGTQVTAPGNRTGMTVANGRVFFTTTDNTLWGFGIYLER